MPRPLTPYEMLHNPDGSVRRHSSLGEDGRIQQTNTEGPWLENRDIRRSPLELLTGNNFSSGRHPYEYRQSGVLGLPLQAYAWLPRLMAFTGGHAVGAGRQMGLPQWATEAARPSGWGKDWWSRSASRALPKVKTLVEDGHSRFDNFLQRQSGKSEGHNLLTNLLGNAFAFDAAPWAGRYERRDDAS